MNQATNAGRLRRALREWSPLLLIIVGMLAARSTLADHYHVPSGSMEHALVPGDHVVVNKLAYGLRIPFTGRVILPGEEPRRGEIVILDSPDDETRLIKRVVAVGGDRVSVRAGRVTINGHAAWLASNPDRERYGEREVRLNLDHGGGPDLPEIRIPDGHVLVLGDHRGNSRDGRYFGLVPTRALYGRAGGVFWRSGHGPLWQPL